MWPQKVPKKRHFIFISIAFKNFCCSSKRVCDIWIRNSLYYCIREILFFLSLTYLLFTLIVIRWWCCWWCIHLIRCRQHVCHLFSYFSSHFSWLEIIFYYKSLLVCLSGLTFHPLVLFWRPNIFLPHPESTTAKIPFHSKISFKCLKYAFVPKSLGLSYLISFASSYFFKILWRLDRTIASIHHIFPLIAYLFKSWNKVWAIELSYFTCYN